MIQMTQEYNGHGLQFSYPDGWELMEETDEDQVAITVESPDTTFFTVHLLLDSPHLEHVLDTALDAFRDEYDEVDIYTADETIGEFRSMAFDIEFVCLEMINSAFLRAFETDNFTAMLLFQTADLELEDSRPEFDRIRKSLRCDTE